jgi:hypothetical protein
MYHMPKKRPTAVAKGLRFTLPIIRLVLPLDGEKLCASSVEKPASLRPQTLLRLIRIETPLEDLLPAKASPLAPAPDQTSPVQAQKKKTNPLPKTPVPASAGLLLARRKSNFSKRQRPFRMLLLRVLCLIAKQVFRPFQDKFVIGC